MKMMIHSKLVHIFPLKDVNFAKAMRKIVFIGLAIITAVAMSVPFNIHTARFAHKKLVKLLRYTNDII